MPCARRRRRGRGPSRGATRFSPALRITQSMDEGRPPDLKDLRLVQFVPSLWQGGAELVAVNLAFALKDRVGRLLSPSPGGEPYTQRLRDGGVELAIVPRPWPRPVPIVRSARALARVLRRERPHVI